MPTNASSYLRPRITAGAFLLLSVLAGCGGDSSGPTQPQNRSPTASISSPSPGTVFLHGQAANFDGSGADTEDGVLADDALAWSSSRDGPIGTGASVQTQSLSVGAHRILLVVTDSRASKDTAIVDIEVVSAPQSLSISPMFAVLGLSLHNQLSLGIQARDADGRSIANASTEVIIRDPQVLSVDGSTVRASGRGVSDVIVSSAGVSDSARIAVVSSGVVACLVSTTAADYTMEVDGGSTVNLRLRCIASDGTIGNHASIQGTVNWDPGRLSYTGSGNPAAGWTWFANDIDAVAGTLTFSAFSADPVPESTAVAEIVLRASDVPGETTVSVDFAVAGSVEGNEYTILTDHVQSIIRIR